MSEDDFSPDKLRVTETPVAIAASARPPRRIRAGRFLKGPIPWPWIRAAANLPGQSLPVGLVIWFESFCTKKQIFPISLSRFAKEGISEGAARRGLRALEQCGLIAITMSSGRRSVVTLIPSPKSPDDDGSGDGSDLSEAPANIAVEPAVRDH